MTPSGKNGIFGMSVTLASVYAKNHLIFFISLIIKVISFVFKPTEIDIIEYNSKLATYHHSKQSFLGKLVDGHLIL